MPYYVPGTVYYDMVNSYRDGTLQIRNWLCVAAGDDADSECRIGAIHRFVRLEDAAEEGVQESKTRQYRKMRELRYRLVSLEDLSLLVHLEAHRNSLCSEAMGPSQEERRSCRWHPGDHRYAPNSDQELALIKNEPGNHWILLSYPASDETQHLLQNLTCLHELSLYAQMFTVDMGDAIAKMANLPALSIRQSRIQSSAMQALSRSTSIYDLNISDSRIEMDCNLPAKSDPWLVDFTAHNVVFPDSALTFLLKSGSLCSIALSGSRCPVEEYDVIPMNEECEHLDLSLTNIPCSTIVEYAKMSRLRSINLFGTELDDRCLEAYDGHPTLKQIRVGGTRCSMERVLRFIRENSSVCVLYR